MKGCSLGGGEEATFLCRLSHDYHLDIDRDVLTAYILQVFNQAISVDLLGRTVCTTVAVSDWYITNLALLALLEEKTVPSAVRRCFAFISL